ncbi:MAG: metallophosphoesterase [Polyangiales bacterium]
MSWRSRARKAVTAIAVVCAIDAFLVEPHWLEVTHHTRHARVAKPLRVAHISDLHTGGFGVREKALLSALERERPDLVVFTGDVVDDGKLENVRPLLSALHPPLGIFAVEGNWEHWRPVTDAAAFYRSAGARLLSNDAVRLRDDVVLIGLDDALAGLPDPRGALAKAPKEIVTLAAFHSPVAYDDLAQRVDLALAGHTHAGQVRLPLFGAIWLPPGSGRYDRGWYDKMYVSRGVGTSLLRVRFLCRPELAIIDVVP